MFWRTAVRAGNRPLSRPMIVAAARPSASTYDGMVISINGPSAGPPAEIRVNSK